MNRVVCPGCFRVELLVEHSAMPPPPLPIAHKSQVKVPPHPDLHHAAVQMDKEDRDLQVKKHRELDPVRIN